MTEGGRANGEGPPPSTLAAQMVQNQLRPATDSRPGDETTFKKILRDILYDDGAQQETDVTVNAQLIHVVAQVGLTPLATGNPFADVEAAVDSIKVIELTVKRQPEVLFTATVSEGPPLLLELLASLVVLYGRPKSQEFAISPALLSLLTSLSSSTESWPKARQLSSILIDCVDGE
jgi:serine/threonine-protein kinase ATR